MLCSSYAWIYGHTWYFDSQQEINVTTFRKVNANEYYFTYALGLVWSCELNYHFPVVLQFSAIFQKDDLCVIIPNNWKEHTHTHNNLSANVATFQQSCEYSNNFHIKIALDLAIVVGTLTIGNTIWFLRAWFRPRVIFQHGSNQCMLSTFLKRHANHYTYILL